VNMADLTKGNRVYNTHMWDTAISIVNYKVDETRCTINLMEYGRSSTLMIPVKYVDENGAAFQPAGYAKVMYNSSNGLDYIAGLRDFTGYTYIDSDKPLTGTFVEGTDPADMVITLRYERTKYYVTLKFVDEDGNTIQADKQVFGGYYNDLFELTPETIAGYTYKTSSRGNANPIEITMMNNYTVTLTYSKGSSGGGGGGSCKKGAESAIGLSALLAAACVVFLKKKI